MSAIRIAPIVEGHGEVHAARILLDRVWREIVGGEYVEVLQPVRVPKSKLLNRSGGADIPVPDEHELGRAVEYVAYKLLQRECNPMPALILVLFDANGDCPGKLAPQVIRVAQQRAGAYNVACVIAKPEYETWFVAAAESLGSFLTLSDNDISGDPEEQGLRKGWIKQRFAGNKYSETADQPRMTAIMDLQQCRRRSPSFDKLCRELESRLRA